MTEFIEDQEPDWGNTYLLGWYDANGRGYLTTWGGDLPIVAVVVTGFNAGLGPPMWDAPVPEGAKLHRIPNDSTPEAYAKKLGGVHAIGWRVPVKRKER
jgi:hypothetical protein